MNVFESIEHSNNLSELEKLAYYMRYFCDCLPSKASVSFERFCSNKNIIKHDVGDCWEERGFASQSWVNLTAPSIYHSVYHKLTLL